MNEKIVVAANGYRSHDVFLLFQYGKEGYRSVLQRAWHPIEAAPGNGYSDFLHGATQTCKCKLRDTLPCEHPQSIEVRRKN